MFLNKLKNLLGIKTQYKVNIFPVQENDSVMCEYIGFIDFMLADKKLYKFVFSS